MVPTNSNFKKKLLNITFKIGNYLFLSPSEIINIVINNNKYYYKLTLPVDIFTSTFHLSDTQFETSSK